MASLASLPCRHATWVPLWFLRPSRGSHHRSYTRRRGHRRHARLNGLNGLNAGRRPWPSTRLIHRRCVRPLWGSERRVYRCHGCHWWSHERGRSRVDGPCRGIARGRANREGTAIHRRTGRWTTGSTYSSAGQEDGRPWLFDRRCTHDAWPHRSGHGLRGRPGLRSHLRSTARKPNVCDGDHRARDLS